MDGYFHNTTICICEFNTFMFIMIADLFGLIASYFGISQPKSWQHNTVKTVEILLLKSRENKNVCHHLKKLD